MKPFGFASMIAAIAQPFAAYGNSRIEVGNAVVMVAVRGHDADGGSVNRNRTGFIVGNSRYVITANHVVMPPPQGWAKNEFALPDVTFVVRLRDQQTGVMTEVRLAHVFKAGADRDAALLEFDGLPRPGLVAPVIENDGNF
jgi:hypothetical protein